MQDRTHCVVRRAQLVSRNTEYHEVKKLGKPQQFTGFLLFFHIRYSRLEFLTSFTIAIVIETMSMVKNSNI